MKIKPYKGPRFDAASRAAEKAKKQAEAAELIQLKADVAEMKKPKK